MFRQTFGPIQTLCFLALTSVLSACGGSDGGSETRTVQSVLPYCSDVATPDSPVTITGSTEYFFRTDGNGAVNSSSRPIRHAEIRVLDGAGNVIQCGATDASGNFSLQLPSSPSSHTVQINSRSENSFANAYILNNPTDNSFFSISKAVTPQADTDLGKFTAGATGSLEGGAFNILDQIHNANQYLRDNTAGCSGTYPNCSPVQAPTLVTIYWSPGVNPGGYFGIPSGLSFYLPGDKQLYILGGINGDIDNSDTDHFDNSIILHEYAHFLEDVYSSTDSPGGSHNGNKIIDPRLAWGEGWANFFQAAVLDNPIYRDTYGTPDGSPGVFFSENLEVPTNDVPLTAGEGNFREFSVSRLLWDSIDTVNEGAGTDEVSGNFGEFWAAFTSSPGGFAGDYAYRSIGLFHVLQAALPSAQNWSSIQTGEKHEPTRENYGNSLTLGGACGTTSIQAAQISSEYPENGSFANSNMFASNDFYEYYHAGGTFTFGLSYTTTGGNAADLDVIVWDSDYTYGLESDAVASASTTIAITDSSGTEAISTSLPAGQYMINVFVYTKDRLGSAADYSMTVGGQAACPD